MSNNVTKTGPVGLKGLNTKASSADWKNLAHAMYQNSQFYNDWEGVNFDDEIKKVNEERKAQGMSTFNPNDVRGLDIDRADLYEGRLEDLLARQQSGISQLVNGLGKMTTTAAATFVDGTLGFAWGLGQGLVNVFDDDPDTSFRSGLWNNKIMKGMSNFQEAAERWMPNYYTDRERNGAWYESVFTPNFIGDKFLKNAGFTIGTMAVMAVPGLNLIGGAAGSAAFNVAKAVSASSAGLKVANKAGQLATRFVNGFLTANGEANIEAYNAAKELQRLEIQKLDKKLETQLALNDEQKRQNLASGMDAIQAAEIANSNEKKLRAEYATVSQKIKENLTDVGNGTWFGNIIALMISNNIQFKGLLSGGFNQRRGLQSLVKGFIGENEVGITREFGEALGKGAGAKFVANEIKHKGLKTAAATTRNMISEGTEELVQNLISGTNQLKASVNINNDIKSLKDKYSPENFSLYSSALNPEATSNYVDTMKAVGKIWKDQFGSIDKPGWEEFFLGALTGGMGTIQIRPSSQSRITQEGKSKRKIELTWGGGFAEARREIREEQALRDQKAEQLNRIFSDDKFRNRTSNAILMSSLAEDINKAVENRDVFTMKNIEYALIAADAFRMKKEGLSDVYEGFLKGIANGVITDEMVDDIKLLTSVAGKQKKPELKGYKRINDEVIVNDGNRNNLINPIGTEQIFDDKYKSVIKNLGDLKSDDEIKDSISKKASDILQKMKEVSNEYEGIFADNFEDLFNSIYKDPRVKDYSKTSGLDRAAISNMVTEGILHDYAYKKGLKKDLERRRSLLESEGKPQEEIDEISNYIDKIDKYSGDLKRAKEIALTELTKGRDYLTYKSLEEDDVSLDDMVNGLNKKRIDSILSKLSEDERNSKTGKKLQKASELRKTLDIAEDSLSKITEKIEDEDAKSTIESIASNILSEAARESVENEEASDLNKILETLKDDLNDKYGLGHHPIIKAVTSFLDDVINGKKKIDDMNSFLNNLKKVEESQSNEKQSDDNNNKAESESEESEESEDNNEESEEGINLDDDDNNTQDENDSDNKNNNKNDKRKEKKENDNEDKKESNKPPTQDESTSKNDSSSNIASEDEEEDVFDLSDTMTANSESESEENEDNEENEENKEEDNGKDSEEKLEKLQKELDDLKDEWRRVFYGKRPVDAMNLQPKIDEKNKEIDELKKKIEKQQQEKNNINDEKKSQSDDNDDIDDNRNEDENNEQEDEGDEDATNNGKPTITIFDNVGASAVLSVDADDLSKKSLGDKTLSIHYPKELGNNKENKKKYIDILKNSGLAYIDFLRNIVLTDFLEHRSGGAESFDYKLFTLTKNINAQPISLGHLVGVKLNVADLGFLKEKIKNIEILPNDTIDKLTVSLTVDGKTDTYLLFSKYFTNESTNDLGDGYSKATYNDLNKISCIISEKDGGGFTSEIKSKNKENPKRLVLKLHNIKKAIAFKGSSEDINNILPPNINAKLEVENGTISAKQILNNAVYNPNDEDPILLIRKSGSIYRINSKNEIKEENADLSKVFSEDSEKQKGVTVRFGYFKNGRFNSISIKTDQHISDCGDKATEFIKEKIQNVVDTFKKFSESNESNKREAREIYSRALRELFSYVYFTDNDVKSLFKILDNISNNTDAISLDDGIVSDLRDLIVDSNEKGESPLSKINVRKKDKDAIIQNLKEKIVKSFKTNYRINVEKKGKNPSDYLNNLIKNDLIRVSVGADKSFYNPTSFLFNIIGIKTESMEKNGSNNKPIVKVKNFQRKEKTDSDKKTSKRSSMPEFHIGDEKGSTLDIVNSMFKGTNMSDREKRLIARGLERNYKAYDKSGKDSVNLPKSIIKLDDKIYYVYESRSGNKKHVFQFDVNDKALNIEYIKSNDKIYSKIIEEYENIRFNTKDDKIKEIESTATPEVKTDNSNEDNKENKQEDKVKDVNEKDSYSEDEFEDKKDKILNWLEKIKNIKEAFTISCDQIMTDIIGGKVENAKNFEEFYNAFEKLGIDNIDSIPPSTGKTLKSLFKNYENIFCK